MTAKQRRDCIVAMRTLICLEQDCGSVRHRSSNCHSDSTNSNTLTTGMRLSVSIAGHVGPIGLKVERNQQKLEK
jgi:hypothetical protein